MGVISSKGRKKAIIFEHDPTAAAVNSVDRAVEVEAAEVAIGDLQNEVPSRTGGGWLRQDPPTVKSVFGQQ